MRRYIIIFAIIVLSINQLQAQVDREVEVTKAYIPTVEKASKPLLKAVITDTAYINPNVDYTITPLSINTPLQTKAINPATVTYWEFNRPATAQIKVGAGFPLNTLVDGYISTHNASVGYLAGSINHNGNYSKIEDINATEVLNDIDLAGGLYIAGRTLHGDIAYSNDSYRNYAFNQIASPNINYQQLSGSIRYGDSFINLSRLNYSIGGSYSHFYDCRSNINNTLELRGDIGKEITLGKAMLSIGYNNISSEDSYENKLFNLSASIEKQIFNWSLNFGVDYNFDKSTIDSKSTPNHFFVPKLSIYKTIASGISPFVELNGSVISNSYAQLSEVNPYIASGTAAQSSFEYYFRGGIMGQNQASSLSYKLYVDYAVCRNSRFWALDVVSSGDDIYSSSFNLGLSGLNTTSINAEVNYSPRTNFSIVLAGRYNFYDSPTEAEYVNSLPNFDLSAGVEYSLRKIRVGVKAEIMGDRRYTVRYFDDPSSTVSESEETLELPSTVDLSAYINWRADDKFSFFIQGDNLCGAELYPWPMYKGFGVRVTAGVKINFR